MATSAQTPPLVIRPSAGWAGLFSGVALLWRYRELVGFLALRDLKIRYKQSLLGPAWALLQPLLTLAVFSGLFSLLLGPERLPRANGASYALSCLCALAPWQLFARGVTAGGDSLVVNQALVTKVWFPRLAIPLAPVLAALADFALSFALIAVLVAFSGVTPGAGLWLLPLLVLLTLVCALGTALWLASINALYRDVRVALPFLVQLWMLVTPVVYTAESLLHGRPESALWLYGLNPMVGVVEGFRFALLGGAQAPWALLGLSAATTTLLLASGLAVFHRLEPHFADRV
jgi:lipopolysaccharide transport system permease protein